MGLHLSFCYTAPTGQEKPQGMQAARTEAEGEAKSVSTDAFNWLLAYDWTKSTMYPPFLKLYEEETERLTKLCGAKIASGNLEEMSDWEVKMFQERKLKGRPADPSMLPGWPYCTPPFPPEIAGDWAQAWLTIWKTKQPKENYEEALETWNFAGAPFSLVKETLKDLRALVRQAKCAKRHRLYLCFFIMD